jgi:hypothetical protein
MKTSRRKFAKVVGASIIAPVIAPTVGLSYIERAELEIQQTGEVSAELTLALLDAQGARSIFSEPEHFEELRRSLTRKIRDHKILRDFPVPPDIEPLLAFRR